MQRITVIDKTTGQKGTVGINRFDPNKYIQIGPVQSAAYNVAQAAPAVVGGTAGLLGTLAGTATTGPGGLAIGALGGGAGYAGGQALKDLILKNFGLSRQTPEQGAELAANTLQGSVTPAIGGATSVGLAKILPYLFSPLKKFGQAREAAASKISITPEQAQSAIDAAQSTMKTTPVQQAGKNIGMDWLRELFPTKQLPTGELGQAPISGNEFYKILGELEKTAKSFTPAAGSAYPQGQAATSIASNLRQIPGAIDPAVGRLNSILSALYKVQPFAKKLGYGAAGAAGAGAITYPILRALGIGGGNK